MALIESLTGPLAAPLFKNLSGLPFGAASVGNTTVGLMTWPQADSTGGLDTADTGQNAFTLDQGTASTWGISSHQGRVVTAGNGASMHGWDFGAADGKITSAFYGMSAGWSTGVFFRATDANNFWMVDTEIAGPNYTIKLWKCIAGLYTGAAQATNVLIPDGVGFDVTMVGSSIAVAVSGTTLLTTDDTFNQTATKEGYFFAGSSSSLLTRFGQFKHVV